MPDDILYELTSRCALRDQSALKTLYERTSPSLNRVAFNILRSEDLSNDVLQDSFIQVWQNADRYRPDLAQPLTSLSSIVRYRSLDRLAIENKHSKGRDVDSEIAEIPSDKFMNDDLISSQQQQSFFDCLETLHERGKSVIQLAYLHGYSREELAVQFDTNVNTIKSWLSHNNKRLKTCLTNKGLTTP
jgi:RNA polymerase sigma-70 factor (ECF subfamily)